MSSSDQVRVSFIKEVALGVLPSGDLGTCRILTDNLSGTPRTISNDETTGDRMSTGLDVIGLDVGGGFGVKLSPDPFHDAMIEAAMMGEWSTTVSDTADFTLDVAAGTITQVGGTDLTTLFSPSDMLTLSGMVNVNNNGMVYVLAVTEDTLTVIFPSEMTDETTTGSTISLDPFVEIGKEEISYSFIKDFTDLTQESITYLGQKSNGFEFNFTFGEHVTGDYTLAGIGWDSPIPPDSDGRTINPYSDEDLLNASQDMGLVVMDGERVDFCIKSLALTLENGLNPKECVGSMAPVNQFAGYTVITADMEAYLSDSNFDMVRDKMAATPVNIAYYSTNSDGNGYAFQLPAVQLTFPDPANSGKDTQSMITATGVAKKDKGFGNILRIYKVSALGISAKKNS
jgi:hypothetical protein